MPSSVSLFYPPRRREETPDVPVVTRAQFLIDVSNYQGILSPDWFSLWGNRGYSGLIVQAVTGVGARSYTRQQLEAAQEAGWEINGYVWCRYAAQRIPLFDGFPIIDLWLDVEDTDLKMSEVNSELEIIDSYMEKRCGIYTGKWVFDRLGWSNRNYWADRELWASIYDNIADAEVGFVPFGGWTHPTIKQFTDTPLDQNVRW